MHAQHRDDGDGDGDGDTALMASLSFRKADEDDDDEALISALDCGSPQQISAAPRKAPVETGDGDGVDSDDDDFEFAFLLRDPETGARISAGDVFASGQIRPVYPVFGRRLLPDVAPRGGAAEDEKEVEVSVQSLQHLFVEEREANPTGSASDDEEVDLGDISEVPPESHCAPGSSASPARCKKSNSTGSLLRWRIKDLVMGRSHSDGKEKFVFLAAEKREPESKDEKKAAEAVAFKEKRNWSGGHRPRTGHDSKTQPAAAADKDKEGKQTKGVRGGGTKAVEMDMATAHQMFYGNASRPAKGAPRRSFLPYKRDLFGLFASTNGLSRTYHPL